MKSLDYNPHSKIYCCTVPLGGIFWEDELPDSEALFKLSEEERYYPYQILGVRRKLWADESLSNDEQEIWNFAKKNYPNWPVFRRISITEEHYQQQLECEKEAEQFFDAIFSDADEIEVSQKNEEMRRWSATFNLEKGKNNKLSKE